MSEAFDVSPALSEAMPEAARAADGWATQA
jgi:hypothetical protein